MSELTTAQKLDWINRVSHAGDRGDWGDSSHAAQISPAASLGDSGRVLSEADQQRMLALVKKQLGNDAFAPPAYPIDALGPLAEVCRAVAEHGQLEPAMAGQPLLATAALLTQSMRRVRTFAGVKPISLYMQTIGDSGDGKSTSESVALAPVNEWQREQSKIFALTKANAQEKTSKTDGASDLPRQPYRIARDATVEGIRHCFQHGLPTQGLFTSEAAALLCGYGLKPENRAKSAAQFNALWDSGEISISRSTAGRVQLYGRFLSLHWMIQPSAVREILYDPLLSEIGMWPRFLIAWPAPMKPRRALDFQPEKIPAIGHYWARCAELLRYEIDDDCADIPILEFDTDAFQLAQIFFERMENAARLNEGQLACIKPFAVRATEHVFRVAAVLAVFGGKNSIDVGTASNAIELVTYSLDIWRLIFGAREESDARKYALDLYKWLLKKPLGTVNEKAVLSIGPKHLRTAARRDQAIATLEDAGLIVRSEGILCLRRPSHE